MQPIFVPYCGQALIPGGAHWNLDPVLIAVLLLWLASYMAVHSARSGKSAAFAAGWSLCALTLISPLCSLGVALFSARVSQHMILTLVAAPLVAYGYWGFSERRQSWRGAILATAGFATVLWFWHAPPSYDATFTSDVAYWAMHVSLFATAMLLWRTLLNRRSLGTALLASFATGAQMCALGALLVLAPRSLYWVHALSTGPWGLSPLADQQLGGLIMWIPGGVLLTCHALWVLFSWMEPAESSRPMRILAQ